jgi:hypothetical protein
VQVWNAEELDEMVEGLRLTKSINTPTSSPVEKKFVQVLNAEELDELTKSIKPTSSPILKKNWIVQVLNAEELDELVEGLESNQITNR